MKLLVVEDEPQIAASLRTGLVAEGFDVDVCEDGTTALWQATTGGYDAIVLDLMLPSLSGAEVVARLRQRGILTPVLMLTAMSDDATVAATLNAGADDYLTKPFGFVVLLARLRALLRRTAPDAVQRLEVGSLELDLERMQAARRGEPLSLTPREIRLLERLMRTPDVVVSKQELLDDVWGEGFDGPTNVVEVYVGYLRRKIDSPYGVSSLRTVRGFGYVLHRVE